MIECPLLHAYGRAYHIPESCYWDPIFMVNSDAGTNGPHFLVLAFTKRLVHARPHLFL